MGRLVRTGQGGVASPCRPVWSGRSGARAGGPACKRLRSGGFTGCVRGSSRLAPWGPVALVPRLGTNVPPRPPRLQARQLPRMVSLVTFGIEKLDAELAKEASRLGGGARALIGEPTLRTALLRSHGLLADVIADARQFPDPDCHNLRGHTGNNPEVIRRIVRHDNFRRWLGALKADFRSAAQARSAQAEVARSGHVEVGVALFCRAGKHRSVACAIILAHILGAVGWSCLGPRHLSRGSWGRRCCLGQCADCLASPPALQSALDAALQVWRQA
jgi:hypothetical protein